MIPLCGPELPTGTVTFVFTDVEGSTLLLDELSAEAYADALAYHRVAIRKALHRKRRRRGGHAGRCLLLRLPHCAWRARSLVDNRGWLDVFLLWWERGFFLMSDRWEEALRFKEHARAIWSRVAPAIAPG